MGKILRKQEKKLAARRNAADISKANRKAGRGGGGYADPKHAEGVHRPGSMTK